MIAITFPEHNTVLGKGQEDIYQPLPAWFGQLGETPQHTVFVFCHELSTEELNVINHTKQIWSSQLTFGQKLNPVNMSVDNPFEAPKEYPAPKTEQKGFTARETEMLGFLERMQKDSIHLPQVADELQRFIQQIRQTI